MTYPYGMKGAPAVGGGLPGLPHRTSPLPPADITSFPTLVRVVRVDETYRIPDWATFARVTSIGKGGAGVASNNSPGGGGGGGLAGTDIERVTPGTIIMSSFTAAATLAAFHNYQLSGGNGGNGANSTGGVGGIGSGGFINFNGGAGGAGSGTSGGGGGGAAGRGGHGNPGQAGAGQPGGAGGLGVGYFQGGGGGGAGQPSLVVALAGKGWQQSSAVVLAGIDGKSGTATVGQQSSGGDGGGGSGGTDASVVWTRTSGDGLVIIELW